MTAAGDATIGRGDLAVTPGEARVFRFVRDGGFSGTWTADGDPGDDDGFSLPLDLTVDGDDLLLTFDGDGTTAMHGNAWRLRRDDVTKLRGQVVAVRASDDPGDGTVTFTDADEVAVTVSVVSDGGGTAAETSVAAGGLLDPDTAVEVWEAAAEAAGLDAADTDVATESAILPYVVTDDDATVAGRLANAANFLVYLLIKALQTVRRFTGTTTEAQTAALRWGLGQPYTGPYMEVCGAATHTGRAFACDAQMPGVPTASNEYRYLVRVPAGTVVTADSYLEVLTQTADDGVGAWDAEECAIWCDYDGNLRVFGEWTADGGTAEVVGAWSNDDGGGLLAPTYGVWIMVKDRVTAADGVRTFSVMTDGGWLTLGTFTADDAPSSFYDSGETWRIGCGGAGEDEHLHVAWVEHYHDDVLVSRVDAANATDDQTVPDDVLESAPGTPAEWTAVDTATVVTPTEDSGLPAVGTSGQVIRSNGTAWTAATLGYSDLSGAPSLATVATSGSYTDLSSKPTVPALADAAPLAPGTAAVGTSPDAAREDHVHPHVFGSGIVPLWQPSSTNGTWVPNTSFDFIANGSPADGHWIQWTNVPMGGTYTFGAAVQQTNSSGKYQLSIDGVDVGSLLDGYAASNTATVLSAAGIVVTPGLHTVRVTVNGKNASSSGYVCRLAGLHLLRTA